MKKIIIFLLALLLLAGCSGERELKSFIENYNDNAYEYDLVQLIDQNNLQEVRQEKSGRWRQLINSDDYRIEAKYNDKDELIGYFINLSDGDYVDMKGEGYESALVIAKTLGLDIELFNQNFQDALKSNDITDSVEYTDEYKVTLIDLKVGDEQNGMVIHYDEVEE